MSDGRDVIIIGGGISGLAAALKLGRISPGLRATLLERERGIGGWIQTEHADGFTVEAGPDSFLSTKPVGVTLAREVGLGNCLDGVSEDTRGSSIMRDGRLHPLPEGLSGLVPARLGPLFRSGLLSYRGRARVALEQAVPAREGVDDESLRHFMQRRFGVEAYDALIEPLMSGIYGGKGDELSLLATFPQLRKLEVEHGSVIRGLRRTSPAPTPGRRPSPFVTLTGGMGTLPQAVARQLGARSLLTGTLARGVKAAPGGYDVQLQDGGTLHGRALILTTPAFITADLVSSVDPVLADLHGTIPYGSTATVSLGFPRVNLRDGDPGHGYIIPRREGRPVMAITFSSRKFRDRAPAGAFLARGFIRPSHSGGIVDTSDTDLIDAVREELRLTLGIASEPIITRVFRLPRSMPQYTVGHVERVDKIETALRSNPGLFVAGAAYRGVGIPDCILSGEAAAHAAASFLS